MSNMLSRKFDEFLDYLKQKAEQLVSGVSEQPAAATAVSDSPVRNSPIPATSQQAAGGGDCCCCE